MGASAVDDEDSNNENDNVISKCGDIKPKQNTAQYKCNVTHNRKLDFLSDFSTVSRVSRRRVVVVKRN